MILSALLMITIGNFCSASPSIRASTTRPNAPTRHFDVLSYEITSLVWLSVQSGVANVLELMLARPRSLLFDNHARQRTTWAFYSSTCIKIADSPLIIPDAGLCQQS
jgi:hypothetical protein